MKSARNEEVSNILENLEHGVKLAESRECHDLAAIMREAAKVINKQDGIIRKVGNIQKEVHARIKSAIRRSEYIGELINGIRKSTEDT